MPFSEDLKEAGPLTEQILQVCDLWLGLRRGRAMA
jgi:hypothetical protein